jgi:SAM-dependent methyltransferase
MRAAATLMRLDIIPSPDLASIQQVICDLGCGDGEFLIGLLSHINSPIHALPVHGLGIDYNASLIATATLNAVTAQQTATWLTYDFNLDEDDLFAKIKGVGVSHVFVYLVPKQLELKTVRALLTRLRESGVMICCHKFQPGYFKATRTDHLMDLVVYEA